MLGKGGKRQRARPRLSGLLKPSGFFGESARRCIGVKSALGSSTPMDNLSKQERSERMSRIKGADTGPEMIVRRLVHHMGFRYRLHVRALPGNPDMVFPRLGKIIFVHGCFWHQHPGCGRMPKSRLDFWKTKLSQNRQRDLRNLRMLQSMGWRTLIVWEGLLDGALA